jgi:hypothetical protein
MTTSGKSGTKDNPMGIPRGLSWHSTVEEDMKRMRANVRKYGMSKTQWRRLRHVRKL